MLPFTRDQFFSILVDYNVAIWPAQIVAYLLGVVAVGLVFRPSATSGRAIAAILALMWIWTGLAYHATFFTRINPAAYGFAAIFVAGGLGFAYAAVTGRQLEFGFRPGPAAWIGLVFVAYAAILYPLIGMAFGHAYPMMPMFGVTPCPVTIFTFGMLLLTVDRVSRWFLAMPFVWSLIGGSAAFLLDVPQDWLLLASGLITVPLLIVRDRRQTG